MRAIFGAVSLLVVLAIVGMVGVRQLRATGHVSSAGMAAAGTSPASGTPQQQAQRIQQQVTDDLAKAMAQGAARTRDADAP